jgi:hypothetical protein
MTLFDVDGGGPLEPLAVAAAHAVARAIERHGIAGSIGIDFPTLAGKAARTPWPRRSTRRCPAVRAHHRQRLRLPADRPAADAAFAARIAARRPGRGGGARRAAPDRTASPAAAGYPYGEQANRPPAGAAARMDRRAGAAHRRRDGVRRPQGVDIGSVTAARSAANQPNPSSSLSAAAAARTATCCNGWAKAIAFPASPPIRDAQTGLDSARARLRGPLPGHRRVMPG